MCGWGVGVWGVLPVIIKDKISYYMEENSNKYCLLGAPKALDIIHLGVFYTIFAIQTYGLVY